MAKLTLGGVIAAVRRLDSPTADVELLRRFVAQREDDAFAQLVARYGGLVLGACRRIVPDTHLAEDAFQATFLVLATKAPSLDGTRPIGPWLYSVACKVAVRARAMVGRRRRREILTAAMPSVPVLSVEQDDTTTILDEEIGKLSAVCREAVVLCELQGLSRKEAAIRLGIAEGTLSSRLAAARKTLATRLRTRGVTGPLVFTGVVVPASLASAAVASATGSASAVVLELSKGTLQAMLLSKLKLASVLAVVGVLVIGISGWGKPLSGSIVSASAPLAPPDLGLIWLHNTQTNKLLAYSPNGRKQQELTLNDSVQFLGFTADGTKLLFAGQGTQVAGLENNGGLTLHFQDVGDKTRHVDTGLAYRSGDQFVIAPDGKRIVRQRLAKPGDGTSYHQYSHIVFDLATRTEIPLQLASNQQVMQWSAEGQAWRVFEFNLEKNDAIPTCRWLSVPVNGDKPTAISDSYSLNWLEPALNGNSFLATGHQHPNGEAAGPSVFRLNAATGNATKIKTFEKTAFAVARRSLDDKQIVCMKYDFDRGGQCVGDAHLLVFDADGKNEKTLLDLSNDQQQTVLLGWFPSASVAARAIPEFLTVERSDEPSTSKDEKAKAVQSTVAQAAVPAPVSLGNSPAAKELAEIYRVAIASVSSAKGADVGKLSIEAATKLVAHARKYPTDESSLEGLVTALSYSSRSPEGAQIANEAVAVMKLNFAGSSALRRHLRILASGMSDSATNFVREIIKSHPDKQLRALAAKRLIAALEFRVRYADNLNADAERRLEYEQRIGKEAVAKFLAEMPGTKREIETYRTALRTELKDQFPSLEVGSVAPETVSVNLEGKPVKLSELRGKVVVLDFWAVWCGPCRALFPHIRELVKDFRGKPFEFVGICIDEEKKTLTEFLEKESLPWTHWWDGKKTVTEQWDIAGFPTFFVIDHKGVIRFTSLGYDPKSGKLEALIKELVKAAEGGK